VHKIKYLEGLRGVAALMVLFGHLTITCFITEQQNLYSIINEFEIYTIFKLFIINSINRMVDGNLAVWIFWVLSSYVISIQFFRNTESSDKVLVGYFSKRYFRLVVPVFFSIMLAYLLLRFGLMYNHNLANKIGLPYSSGWLNSLYSFEPDFLRAIKSGVFSVFFKSNGSDYNPVLWSIQNEFLGSLFTFSVFGVIRHNSKRYILYFLIFVVLIALHMLWLSAFLFGHILCDYDFSDLDDRLLNYLKKTENFVHRYNLVVLMFSILFVVFKRELMLLAGIPEYYHQLILSIFIVYICLRNKYYQSLFSLSLPFWLGNISFGLYVIHLPILCSLTSYLVFINCSLNAKIFAVLITFFLVLFFSVIFTKFIDKKAVVYANRIGDYFKKYS